jgi:hypothetical protein
VANTIGFGADDAALELKQTLVEHLKAPDRRDDLLSNPCA